MDKIKEIVIWVLSILLITSLSLNYYQYKNKSKINPVSPEVAELLDPTFNTDITEWKTITRQFFSWDWINKSNEWTNQCESEFAKDLRNYQSCLAWD